MVLPDFRKEKAEVAAILGGPWDESVPAGMDNPATDAKGNVTGGFTKCCRTEGPWDKLSLFLGPWDEGVPAGMVNLVGLCSSHGLKRWVWVWVCEGIHVHAGACACA